MGASPVARPHVVLGAEAGLRPVVGTLRMVWCAANSLPRVGVPDSIARWLSDIFFRSGGAVARCHAMVGGGECLGAIRRAAHGRTT